MVTVGFASAFIMFKRVAIIVFATLVLSACSREELWEATSTLSEDYKIGKPYQISGKWYYPHHNPDYDEVGIASWYGPGFHGKQTANGEIYDQNALTAAHPTLPMPVLVRVTNLENGRSMILRVNDRGPFVDGRIIDVSRHAAERLGFRRAGIAWVRVKYLSGGPGSVSPTQAASASPLTTTPSWRQLFVHAGSERVYESALTLRNQLRHFGEVRIDEIVADGELVYRVRLGPWKDWESAYDILRLVLSRGYSHAQIVAVEEHILGGADLLVSQ